MCIEKCENICENNLCAHISMYIYLYFGAQKHLQRGTGNKSAGQIEHNYLSSRGQAVRDAQTKVKV